MSVDVDSSYVTEDSNVETVEEVTCSRSPPPVPEEFDSRLLLGNLSNLRFPLKLWRIVSDCNSGAIQWIYGGTAIAINYQIFEREYLDASKRLFKTNNITSFVRQLNLYGFRKVPKNSKSGQGANGSVMLLSFSSASHSIFHHDSFRSDRPDLLLHVNRRGIKPDGNKKNNSNRTSSRPRREPRRRLTVSSEQTTTTSSDSESSETESSTSVEQVIEDGIVELDQAELIIPLGGQEVVTSATNSSIGNHGCNTGGGHEVGDLIPLPLHDSSVSQKTKRKTQHQPRHIEAKRVRVKSESAAVGQHSYHQQIHQHQLPAQHQGHHNQLPHAGGSNVGHHHRNGHQGGGIVRSSSLSSSASLHQLVAEEFIRKVRSTSESKDDFECCHDSNGSATYSAVEDEGEGEDEEDDNEIRVKTNNRQFIFDLKGVGSGQSSSGNRERVRVERLSRHFEPAEVEIKQDMDEMHEEEVVEEVIMSDDAIKEEVVEEEDEEEYMPLHDGVVQHVVEDVVLHEEVVEHDDEHVESGFAAGRGGQDDDEVLEQEVDDDDDGIEEADDVPVSSTSKADEYYADEHNTARALLSLTCAKLQRDVSGMKAVMEPTTLTTAGMS